MVVVELLRWIRRLPGASISCEPSSIAAEMPLSASSRSDRTSMKQSSRDMDVSRNIACIRSGLISAIMCEFARFDSSDEFTCFQYSHDSSTSLGSRMSRYNSR